jgi:hypothetical protein
VSALLEVAISCIRRGWFVFPCVPRDKRPLAGLAPRGFLDATNDEAVVRKWWAAKPDANVAIATGPSGLVVVDIDHGLTEAGVWPCWIIDCHTYAVRTGRRPEFGLQLYFQADGCSTAPGGRKMASRVTSVPMAGMSWRRGAYTQAVKPMRS